IAAELRAPEPLADHRGERHSCTIVVGTQESAGQWTRAEYVEEVAGDERARDRDGRVTELDESRKRRLVIHRGDGGEALRFAREGAILLARKGEVCGLLVGIVAPENDEVVCVADGERSDEHAVGDTRNARHRRDA